MTSFTRVLTDPKPHHFLVETGPLRGEEESASVELEVNTATTVQAAFDRNGSGFAAWSQPTGEAAQITVLRYDGLSGAWSSKPTSIPGTAQLGASKVPHRRGAPGVALTPGGEALVVWIQEQDKTRWVSSSRYHLNVGWQSEPTVFFTDPSLEPFTDPRRSPTMGARSSPRGRRRRTEPTLLTAPATISTPTPGRWMRATPRTWPSALAMPRLGTDARGNLLLAWALAGSPTQLAYRRYRAATGEWGEIRLIAGVEASDVTAEPLGTLPFSLAPNGVGGLLFKTEESGGESVKLLLFF